MTCHHVIQQVGLEKWGHGVMGEGGEHSKQGKLGRRTRGKHTWQDLEGRRSSIILIGKERGSCNNKKYGARVRRAFHVYSGVWR